VTVPLEIGFFGLDGAFLLQLSISVFILFNECSVESSGRAKVKTWLACQGSGDGRTGDIGYIHIVLWLAGWVMGKICRYKGRRTICEGAFSGGRRFRIRGDLNFVIVIFFLLSKEVFSGFLDGISILKDEGFILLFTLDGLIELMMDLLASYEKLHTEYYLAVKKLELQLKVKEE
jgi:hypothetical protein